MLCIIKYLVWRRFVSLCAYCILHLFCKLSSDYGFYSRMMWIKCHDIFLYSFFQMLVNVNHFVEVVFIWKLTSFLLLFYFILFYTLVVLIYYYIFIQFLMPFCIICGKKARNFVFVSNYLPFLSGNNSRKNKVEWFQLISTVSEMW